MRFPWKALAFAVVNMVGCAARPSFSSAEIDASTPGQGLEPGFLLGTASASFQVEGGITNADWNDWETTSFPDGTPHIKHGDVSGDADDSWNKFDADLAAMKQLGTNAYRFSIEWSRVQPTVDSWDDAALDRYLQWATQLRANGIEPMVTLNHFTLPKWVAAQGGWENRATLDAFDAYVTRVVDELGPQVDLWCTINEPNVLATESYIKGIWPPGVSDQKRAGDVLAMLIEAHARAAKIIHTRDTVDADGDGKPAMVGIAHHVRVFQPASASPLDSIVAGLTDDFFNESFINAVKTGRIVISVPGSVNIDRAVPDLKGSFDYLGLNYYTRDHVRANLSDPSLSNQYTPADRPRNDLGWDIYPEGLYLFLKRYAGLGLPIYITENGIADAAGTVRPEFIRAHFYAIQKATAEGVDVRGYFHWSLIDNFEWVDGWDPKFGLFHVDRSAPDKARTPTSAVPMYQDIARQLGLSPR